MKEKTFGPWLRARRQEAGVSLRDLARQGGISFSYLSKVETGDLPPPSLETIKALASVLSIDPVEAYLESGKVPPLVLHAFEAGVSREVYEAVVQAIEWGRKEG